MNALRCDPSPLRYRPLARLADVELEAHAFTSGPELRARMVRAGVLFPLEARGPVKAWWHEMPPTLRLRGDEAGRPSWSPEHFTARS